MEDVLKLMCTIEGASEYIVTNSEGMSNYDLGIPIKKSQNISP